MKHCKQIGRATFQDRGQLSALTWEIAEVRMLSVISQIIIEHVKFTMCVCSGPKDMILNTLFFNQCMGFSLPHPFLRLAVGQRFFLYQGEKEILPHNWATQTKHFTYFTDLSKVKSDTRYQVSFLLEKMNFLSEFYTLTNTFCDAKYKWQLCNCVI